MSMLFVNLIKFKIKINVSTVLRRIRIGITYEISIIIIHVVSVYNSCIVIQNITEV